MPDLPFADVNGEVVGQLRQYHADNDHRVRASTLVRWYQQRSKLKLPDSAAQFLTLSAIDNRGFSGYWASQVPREDLRKFIAEQVERNAYPARDVVPYLVAACFWPEREQLLAERTGHGLSDRVMQATDRETFLRRSRLGQRVNIRLNGTTYRLDDLYQETDLVQQLFDQILAEEASNDNSRQIAHQFDLWLHADGI